MWRASFRLVQAQSQAVAAAVACVPAGGDCAGGRRHARLVHGVDARAADGVRRVHGIGDYCDCAVLLPAAFSL